MNLASYLPPGSSDTGAVFALLQVLADPAAAKKVLEKIAAEKEALEKLIAKNNALMDAVQDAKKQNVEQAKAQAENEMSLRQTRVNLDQRTNALLAREKELAAREHAHQMEADKLETARRDFSVLGDALNTKNRSLGEREMAIETREKALASSIAKHKRWLETIKAPE